MYIVFIFDILILRRCVTLQNSTKENDLKEIVIFNLPETYKNNCKKKIDLKLTSVILKTNIIFNESY